jgi:hypothetical protein
MFRLTGTLYTQRPSYGAPAATTEAPEFSGGLFTLFFLTDPIEDLTKNTTGYGAPQPNPQPGPFANIVAALAPILTAGLPITLQSHNLTTGQNHNIGQLLPPTVTSKPPGIDAAVPQTVVQPQDIDTFGAPQAPVVAISRLPPCSAGLIGLCQGDQPMTQLAFETGTPEQIKVLHPVPQTVVHQPEDVDTYGAPAAPIGTSRPPYVPPPLISHSQYRASPLIN